jgi:hypothetical protein
MPTKPISVREALEDYRYAILNLTPQTHQAYLHRLAAFADCVRNSISHWTESVQSTCASAWRTSLTA